MFESYQTKTLVKYLFILLASISSLACHGQANSSKSGNRIKVYLLGTFHFAQTDDTYNVLEKKHQESIERLCQTIAKLAPDKVFVERQPEYEFQNKLDSLYEFYLTLTRPLRAKNEIYQVGFRVAKMLDHPKVYQCDNPGMFGTYYQQAVEYAKKNDQLGIIEATAKGTIIREDDRVNEDSVMQNSTLFEYMQWINSEAVMTTSHASYVANDPLIGSKDYYNYDDDNTLIGAEITADWYRRNIMIYTKMINQLSFDEDAIFLLMGGDHIPILRHLFQSNPNFEVVDPQNWLK